jgi:hypothetical protein
MHVRAFRKLTQKTSPAVLALLISATSAIAQNFVDVKPSPQQVAWRDLEFTPQ